MAGDATRRLDDLADTESLAVAEVEDEPGFRCGSVSSALQREQMSIGQVGDVDVVADARAVRCRVVIAIDANRLAAPQSHVENQRNEVRLGLVIFASRDAIRDLPAPLPR